MTKILNPDPLFPHLCPVLLPEHTFSCAICEWLAHREMFDQFYRERYSEKTGERA